MDDLLVAREAATNGLVRLEVLSGAGDERRFERYRLVMSALIQLPVDEATWDLAANMGYTVRRQGVSSSAPDLIVAASAIQSGATLIHADNDFDHIAEHTPLTVESHVEPAL